MTPHRFSLDSVRTALIRHEPMEVNDPERARAAVALVLVPGETGLELLLIRRAVKAGDPWSGQMALPGGRYEERDGALVDTARRETHEETGVVLADTECLGSLDDLAPTTPVLPPIAVRPFVFALPERPEVILNPEADRHYWIPLRQLIDSRQRSTVEVRGNALIVESFLVEGQIVWGMTERILMPFLRLLTS